MENPPSYPTSNPDVFYDLARRQLDLQLETLDSIDSKVGLLFTGSSGLLGILAAVFALKHSDLGVFEFLALVAFLGLYIFIAYQSERAYRKRDWKVGPDLKQVYRQYKKLGNANDLDLKWEIANHLRLDYESNREFARLKSAALATILPCVIAQSIILCLSLVAVAEGW